jgi:HEPN domain-containing protein
MNEGEILKDRATALLENARYLLEKERYDLSAFNLEQSIRLFLKYYIWKKLGDFEKTHNIEKLLLNLKDAYPEKSTEIQKLLNSERNIIEELEIIYIESRYMPVQFPKHRIEEMFNFMDKFEELINKL